MKILLLAISISLAASASAQKLNHIAVFVRDLKTSTAFYHDVVGLDTIPNPFNDGHHTWLSIGGGAQLHLISEAKTSTGPDKMSHLCFSIPSMPAFLDNLKKHQVSFEDWNGKPGAITQRPDGVQQVYFKDPNGWWIEINDAK